MAIFNLKRFIEDFSIARECGDLDEEQELLEDFSNFIKSSSYVVRVKSQEYIFNNGIARQYPDLLDVVSKHTNNF